MALPRLSQLCVIALSLVAATTAASHTPRQFNRLAESLSPFPNATISLTRSSSHLTSQAPLSASSMFAPPAKCPPCNPFNCVLPAFTCLNNGQCNDYNGQCICPSGFGGEDCSKPLCGSLADGADRFPREGETCVCDDGWGGINCNVCETDQACPALLRDPSLVGKGKPGDSDDEQSDAVCYKEGFGIKEMFQTCDVTNRKIVDMLPDRPPQVTFTCDVASSVCGFQFWIGQVESFYCGLSNCTAGLEIGYDSNYTEYACETVECACIPGKMLCGEDGSVDITDFLAEEIKGPAKFSSRSGEGSKFEEPAMNSLINDIFGDSFITLDCKSGECMRASEVPGFVRPPKPNDRALVIASIVLVAAVLLVGLFMFWYLGRANTVLDYSFLGGRIRLPATGNGNGNSDAGKSLLEDHIPAALQFSDLTYTLPNGRVVLDSITGSVQPGEIMAVIGASGAGKSTFLDLLAKKAKTGTVSGEILVNGQKIEDGHYRRLVGFVDQEDTLMGTLTVYETVLYSALLRLPRDMSPAEKKMRVLETMHELGILGIRDSRVGESGERSISGGEKRRVSIACELVTSPSILFLDEPTSGLDSYNAINVVESLVQLSRTYNRTVVFTIHQPRSNIVALFDKLVLLASGKLVYSGNAEQCQSYFQSIGWTCPPGFNIADYLIDLTMQEAPEEPSSSDAALLRLDGDQDAIPVSDPELGVSYPRSIIPTSSTATEDTDLDTRPNSVVANGAKRLFGSGRSSPTSTLLSPRLASLVAAYAASSIAKETREEIVTATTEAHANGVADGARMGWMKATWWTQFTILSGRAFKNLYRNPMLMLSHYGVSVAVACICGFLFQGLTCVSYASVFFLTC